jgi:hypothetical protein
MDRLIVKSLPRCNNIVLSAVTPSPLLSLPISPLIESKLFLLFLAPVTFEACYGLRAAFLSGAVLRQNILTGISDDNSSQ